MRPAEPCSCQNGTVAPRERQLLHLDTRINDLRRPSCRGPLAAACAPFGAKTAAPMRKKLALTELVEGREETIIGAARAPIITSRHENKGVRTIWLPRAPLSERRPRRQSIADLGLRSADWGENGERPTIGAARGASSFPWCLGGRNRWCLQAGGALGIIRFALGWKPDVRVSSYRRS